MKNALIASGVILAWACISGSMDGQDAEITAAAERAARERVETFTFPLEYTATVTQCDRQRECRTKFYYPRQK